MIDTASLAGTRVIHYFSHWIARLAGRNWWTTYIDNWVAIGPLWLGAPKSLRATVSISFSSLLIPATIMIYSPTDRWPLVDGRTNGLGLFLVRRGGRCVVSQVWLDSVDVPGHHSVL